MKNTLEIPDPTFRKAKAIASALGISLREFVTQAVEERLSKGARGREKPWLECAGELAHLHKETKRIQGRIDEEFGQIEPEDVTRSWTACAGRRRHANSGQRRVDRRALPAARNASDQPRRPFRLCTGFDAALLVSRAAGRNECGA